MKRFLIAVMVFTFAAGAAMGQTDGIYSDGDEQRNGADQKSVTDRRQSPGNDANGNNNTYTQGGEVYNDYDNPDDYIDNSESYSSRINRFNYGFYNMGYYSMFYNPFWYSPTWYDPYWGYNPWRRGFTVSFGWGYPGWGWNTWLGYPAWSCWGGGFGYGCGYGYGWGSYYSPLAYTGYYGGYWNRVYAYNNDTRPYGSATYGIRRQGQISQVSGNGVRSSGSGLKQMPDANTRPYAFTRPDQGLSNGNNTLRGGGAVPQQNERPRGWGRIFGGGNNSNNGGSTAESQRPSRGIFGGGNGVAQPGNSNGNSRGIFGGGGNSNGRSIFGGGSGNSGGSRMFNGGGNGAGRSIFSGGGRSGGGSSPSRGGGGGGVRSGGGSVGGRRR